MIESRAQRRKTLLHKRKVAIIAFTLVFAILLSTLLILNNYFNTVFKFRDYDETIYYVKQVDGVFGMYDEDDNLLTQSTPPGSLEKMYITKIGTWVDIDPVTGETKIRAIPDLYYSEDGEELDKADLIVVFPSIETNDIKSIEVKNAYGEYSIVSMKESDDASKYFVLGESPFISTEDNAISYITYYAAHVTANERLDRDKVKSPSEYGLVAETRIDSEGNLYEYEPSYYIVTSDSGEKHKLIIGDSLVDGSGYYVQYENAKGKVRDAVYIIKPADISSVSPLMTYENTIMGPAKNYLSPSLIFSQSGNTYYEVENFSVSSKNGDEYDELINFSYIDLEDRTGTIEGNHPYRFNETSFSSYRPNHDNIDAMITSLIEPEIIDIVSIDPSNEDKVKHGIMSVKVDENGDPILDEKGNIQYFYDAEYVLKFDKYITMTVVDSDGKSKEEKFKITQKVYISKMNERGNYYTYTLITMPEATDKGMVESININIINEVSETTFAFLKWDPYNWVYPSFMQIRINYVEKIDISFGDYDVTFDLNHGKIGELTTLGVNATDSKNQSVSTFASLEFYDRDGYYWLVTPQRIYVYDKDGKETSVSTRHYEYNSIGEQVHVMDGFRTDQYGNKVYIEKDRIVIVKNTGATEEIPRYMTTVFKKVFSNIISMKLVDSYVVSDEDIAKIVTDENRIITIKVLDNEGNTQVCEFYNITARKAYVVVDGQGGFYVQSSTIQKLINDIGRFFAGEDIDMDAIT